MLRERKDLELWKKTEPRKKEWDVVQSQSWKRSKNEEKICTGTERQREDPVPKTFYVSFTPKMKESMKGIESGHSSRKTHRMTWLERLWFQWLLKGNSAQNRRLTLKAHRTVMVGTEERGTKDTGVRGPEKGERERGERVDGTPNKGERDGQVISGHKRCAELIGEKSEVFYFFHLESENTNVV